MKNKKKSNSGIDSVERYHFASKIAKNKSVLDVGCGAGYSSSIFVESGIFSYDGVDINEEKIAYAHYKYTDRAYLNKRVNYHVGDISTFNKGKTFDVITCYGVIERVEDYQSALKNLYSLLGYGGVLLISSCNRLISSPSSSSIYNKPMNKEHVQEFTPEELLCVLKRLNFNVSEDNVYGQRQRKIFSNQFTNKFLSATLDKIFYKSRTLVSPVKNKIPEHFIIVATKL